MTLGRPVQDFLSNLSFRTAKLKLPLLGSYLDFIHSPEFTKPVCLSEENSHNVLGPLTARTASQNNDVSSIYLTCVVVAKENNSTTSMDSNTAIFTTDNCPVDIMFINAMK